MPTAHLPHRIDGLFSIDHVAVPTGTSVGSAARVVAQVAGRRLSDHDAYVVEVRSGDADRRRPAPSIGG